MVIKLLMQFITVAIVLAAIIVAATYLMGPGQLGMRLAKGYCSKIIPEIEKYKKKEGTYPVSLSDLKLDKKPSSFVVKYSCSNLCGYKTKKNNVAEEFVMKVGVTNGVDCPGEHLLFRSNSTSWKLTRPKSAQ